MFPSLTSPVIFAHRGASSHAPENTLSAFQLAVDQGARAIELDVQLTKDREVVVFHDMDISRTTDGAGKISSLTLAEIKRFNAGISFSPGYQNEKVPSLAETLDSLPQDIFINIELKNLHTPFDDLPARTASVIRDCKAQSRILISSYNRIALGRFFKEIPTIPLGYLPRSALNARLLSRFPYLMQNLQSIHLSFRFLTPELVKIFKMSGKMVFAYTLNHSQDIMRAMTMGIDGFFTDDPGFAIRTLAQKELSSA